MKFRIIEKPEPTYDIEEVLKDYTETDLPVKEIREKYGISQGQWLTILKHWKREGVTMRGYNKPKFYRYEKRYKRYVVNKTIKSHAYYFGSYRTEEEAKARVRELEENNWNGLLKGE